MKKGDRVAEPKVQIHDLSSGKVETVEDGQDSKKWGKLKPKRYVVVPACQPGRQMEKSEVKVIEISCKNAFGPIPEGIRLSEVKTLGEETLFEIE